MVNYAGMQKTAQNSAILTLGLVTQALRDGDTSGYVAINNIGIGAPAFLYDINAPINASVSAASTGATQPFVGVVYRGQQTASIDFYTQGYSNQIQAGLRVEVLTRGTIAVNVTQQGATAVSPAFGDIVFVLPTGVFFTAPTAGGTLPAGAVQTNFRVVQVPAGFSVPVTPFLIVISNRQNVGV